MAFAQIWSLRSRIGERLRLDKGAPGRVIFVFSVCRTDCGPSTWAMHDVARAHVERRALAGEPHRFVQLGYTALFTSKPAW